MQSIEQLLGITAAVADPFSITLGGIDLGRGDQNPDSRFGSFEFDNGTVEFAVAASKFFAGDNATLRTFVVVAPGFNDEFVQFLIGVPALREIETGGIVNFSLTFFTQSQSEHVGLPSTAIPPASVLNQFSARLLHVTATRKTCIPPDNCSAFEPLFGPLRVLAESEPIPEPSSLLLFGTALAGMGRGWWQRGAE